MLLISCQNGHLPLVAYLLEVCKCNVHAVNKKGNSALHYSVTYGFESITNLLLAKGADCFALNHEGLTCYEGLAAKGLESL